MGLPYAIIAYGHNLADVRRLGLPWLTSAELFQEEVEECLEQAQTSLPELGVRLETHGFADDPQWLLATAVATAEIGAPVDLAFLREQEPRPEWDQALADTLRLLGLRAKESPRWLAYSFLG